MYNCNNGFLHVNVKLYMYRFSPYLSMVHSSEPQINRLFSGDYRGGTIWDPGD